MFKSILRKRINPARFASQTRIAFMGTIKDGGGSWGAKATAEEEKFIHEHEIEAIKTLKAKQAAKASSSEQIEKSKVISSAEKQKPNEKSSSMEDIVTQESLGYASTGGRSGVFGSREGALEDKWIRDHEREMREKK